METYYTKKEYNEMKSILSRKLKQAEKRIVTLERDYKLLVEKYQALYNEAYPLEVEIDETPVEETGEEVENSVTEA
jgi:hypothetical protein